MAATLDFSKLATGGNSANVIDPRKLFTTLARKARFRRPSDQQGDVLNEWFVRRDDHDLTLKMNTGSGKTLVGLLILRSSLNEGVGPAVYIAPDPYLASQVVKEARDLGIEVTEDERSASFLSNKAILVITIKKLFNGRSTFGVGAGNRKIKIGSLVVDDAHACLTMVEEQFSVRVDSGSSIYKKLFKLFKDSLAQQSTVGVVQLEQHDPTVYIPVPFWTWKSHITEIAQLFISNKEDEKVGFTWPLLADCIELCQCVIGGAGLEITPRCIPVDAIPAFNSAKRRVYMTATLADDGVLVTHFDANSQAASTPIRPKGVGDMGDRMILIPQEINPKSTDDELKLLLKSLAASYNVVVIVPSKKRAEYWKDVSQQTLNAANIDQGIARLKNGEHVGLTVLLNKYDGVDLPDDACRVLVVDGLPEVYGLAERVEFAALDGTEAQLIRQVQRIEQGMGRGVRSSEDFCVVILTGRRLTERLHLPSAVARFTSATQAQLALGKSIAEQVKGKPLNELRPIMDLCLIQTSEWVSASRATLANASEGGQNFVEPTVTFIRTAFNAARTNLWHKRTEAMQAAVNMTIDPATKGYLDQQLAEYTFHVNPNEAQEILLSGIQLNPRITKPLSGITYSKLTSPAVEQATQAIEYMKQFKDGNSLVIWVNGLLEDLSWDEDKTERFESGIKNLGLFIGFGSQRPELEIGKGPDNLWALGNLKYLVIECKSGASTPAISKSDCNQLTGSCEWFDTVYDATCEARPVIIHPHFTFDRYSTPKPETRVIDSEKLTQLKSKVRDYATALSQGTTRHQTSAVAGLLKEAGFTGTLFISSYTRHFQVSSK